MNYVIRWRYRGNTEYPRIERPSADDLRYGFGHATKREAVDSALRSCRRQLEQAQQILASAQSTVQKLEALLAKIEAEKVT